MGNVIVFNGVEEVKEVAKKVEKGVDLREACQFLVDMFLESFEVQENLKNAKDSVKVQAKRIGLTDKQIKTLINLCKLRAKSINEAVEGDLVQQWLFDLENEKKEAESLLIYILQFKR